MINDVIELKLNGKPYSARLDMGAIANAQNNMQKIKKNMTVPEMLDEVKEENYMVINNIIIESIKRCHSTLKTESILENMKLFERDLIAMDVIKLMQASLPVEENDKKKVEE